MLFYKYPINYCDLYCVKLILLKITYNILRCNFITCNRGRQLPFFFFLRYFYFSVVVFGFFSHIFAFARRSLLHLPINCIPKCTVSASWELQMFKIPLLDFRLLYSFIFFFVSLFSFILFRFSKQESTLPANFSLWMYFFFLCFGFFFSTMFG